MKKIDENNHFKTPEGYFEGFAKRLSNKLSKESNNLLDNEGFTIPEGYFDGLHENIERKLDHKTGKLVQLHPYRKYYFAAASVAVLAIVLFGVIRDPVSKPTFQELADTEIEVYFENTDYGLSSYEIAETLSANELEITDILETPIDEERVTQYLLENIDTFDELNYEEYD